MQTRQELSRFDTGPYWAKFNIACFRKENYYYGIDITFLVLISFVMGKRAVTIIIIYIIEGCR